MSHLGDRVPAFVDGQLPHSVRDRVLAHLAGCPACRAAVDAERAVKARLAGLAAPAVSDDLTRKLLALAEPGGPLPPRRRPVGPEPRVSAVPSPGRAGAAAAPGRPPGTGARRPLSTPMRALVPRRPRMPYLAAGSVGAMALALGAALLAGDPDEQGPALVPAVDRFATEHASTVGELPLLDPGMLAQLHFGGQPAQRTTTQVGYGGSGVTGLFLGEVPPR
jgi:anti-sigma factor RsiW